MRSSYLAMQEEIRPRALIDGTPRVPRTVPRGARGRRRPALLGRRVAVAAVGVIRAFLAGACGKLSAQR